MIPRSYCQRASVSLTAVTVRQIVCYRGHYCCELGEFWKCDGRQERVRITVWIVGNSVVLVHTFGTVHHSLAETRVLHATIVIKLFPRLGN